VRHYALHLAPEVAPILESHQSTIFDILKSLHMENLNEFETNIYYRLDLNLNYDLEYVLWAYQKYIANEQVKKEYSTKILNKLYSERRELSLLMKSEPAN